jgi:hypothetical protein
MYQNIFMNHLFGGGVITFLPFFARRRAAIGPSRPTLSDTPNREQTSDADRVCHSREEMSADEKSENQSVTKYFRNIFTSNLFLPFVIGKPFFGVCNMNTETRSSQDGFSKC